MVNTRPRSVRGRRGPRAQARRDLVLCALGLSGGLLALAGCGGGDDDGSAGATDPVSDAQARAATNAALDLDTLLLPVPEYQGQGRNLFAYGAARGAQTSATPVRSQPLPAPTTTIRPTARPTFSTARVDAKYFGFVEKSLDDGDKKKYAIFIDGTDILTGAEGDTVRSFTIVKIGLESVTITPEGSSATQRIPLQSN